MRSPIPERSAVAAAVTMLLAAAPVGSMRGQASPGLQVQVVPSEITTTGATTSITYSIENSAESSDSLDILVLDSPVRPAETITPPRQPDMAYLQRYGYGSMQALTIGFLGLPLRPGERRGGFTVRTSGVPAIVPYWVVPSVPMDFAITDHDPGDAAVRTAFTQDERAGLTVGVVPPPDDQSEGALMGRLSGLVTEACNLGWVGRPPGVCNSLQVKLGEGQLDAFLNELEAQRGQHVTETAYFLLRSNAEYILARS